jgi:hypothetical protein
MDCTSFGNSAKKLRTNFFVSENNKVLDVFDVALTVHRQYYVEIKCQLDATD